MSAKHHIYIQRCIALAKNGLGTTYPNPMAGCVIVHNNCIIGEGFTSPYGGNHAEVNAIHSVKNKALLKEATLYVSLEPCAHFGKTPPCSNRIIEYQIPKVVIGCLDDNPLVAGSGVAQLQKANCQVTVGVLEAECKASNKRFFTFYNKKRPYIILKWAQTENGFIAPIQKKETKPVWISNKESRQLVHKWRSEEQAILVGTNTVLEDNPQLTTRNYFGKNPTRIVLDATLRIPKQCHVFDEAVQTIVLYNTSEKEIKNTKNTLFETIDFKTNVAQQICTILHKNNIQSVLIEGGSQTLQTFIDANLWDEARIFTGNTTFLEGIKAPNFNALKTPTNYQIKQDTLKIFQNS